MIVKLMKEFMKNKGSVILPCVFSIMIIVVMVSLIYYQRCIIKVGTKNDELLTRIYTKNRINEIKYDPNYKIGNFSINICNNTISLYNYNNKYFQIHDLNESYEIFYYYHYDENKKIILDSLEVHGE